MKELMFTMIVAVAISAMAHTPVKTGLWKSLTYDAPDKTPVMFGGWSRAEGVKAGDYCIYLDVDYADGSHDWGVKRTSGKRFNPCSSPRNPSQRFWPTCC